MDNAEMEAFRKTLASLIELKVVVGSDGVFLSMDGTYRIGIPVLDDRVAALAKYIESRRHLKNVTLILGVPSFSPQHDNIARVLATACAKRNTSGPAEFLPPICLIVTHHLHPSWIPSAANFFSSFGSHITELIFFTRGMDHEKPMVEIIAPLCQQLKCLTIYVTTGPNTTSVLYDLMDISSTCELHFVIADYPQVHNASVSVSPMLSNNLNVLLDSREQHLGLRETTSLVTWLQQMHQLALFGLEIKSFNAEGLEVLSDYLQQNSSIREFRLHVAEVQPNRSEILEATLGNVLSSKSSLRKVILSMCGDAHFGLAYQILSGSNRLELLELTSRYNSQHPDDCLVSDDSFVLIAEGIQQSRSLRELYVAVSYNNIQQQENESDYGLDITPLAKALTSRQQGPLCCPLVALILHVNIKPVAIPHLKQALTDPSARLENLDICSYFYSGEDAISLVEAVRDNQSLEYVHFSFNCQSGEIDVINALPSMLAEMEPLKMLKFKMHELGTPIWPHEARLSRELNIGLMDNQSLQYLSIEASPFPSYYRDPAGIYRFDMAREDVFNCCERNVEYDLFIAAFPAHPDPMTALLKELDTTRDNPIHTPAQVTNMLFCCFSSRPDLIGGPRRQQGESSTLLREEP